MQMIGTGWLEISRWFYFGCPVRAVEDFDNTRVRESCQVGKTSLGKPSRIWLLRSLDSNPPRLRTNQGHIHPIPPSLPMRAMQSISISISISVSVHIDLKIQLLVTWISNTVQMFEFDHQSLSTIKSGSSPVPISDVQTWREGSVFRLLYRYGAWEDRTSGDRSISFMASSAVDSAF